MPFKSEKQRRWMWVNKPGLAKKWTKKYGSKVREKKNTGGRKGDGFLGYKRLPGWHL